VKDRGGAPGALRQLFDYLPRVRRRQFWLLLALTLASAVAELATLGAVLPFLSLLSSPAGAPGIPWLPTLIAGDPLASAALLVAAAAVFAGTIRVLLIRTGQSFAYGLGHDVNLEIQRRVLDQPYSWHVAHGTREVLASLEKVQLLSHGVALQLVQGLSGAVIGVALGLALIAIEPLGAALAAGLLAVVYLGVSAATRRRLVGHSGSASSALGARIGVVQESLGGIRDVILDRAQALYLAAFSRIDLRLSRARSEAAFLSIAPRYAIEVAGMVLFAVAAVLLARREGGFADALPVLGALALGAQRLLPLIQQVYQSWSTVTANRAVTADLLALLSLPTAPPEESEEGPPLPLEREIRLEGVNFSYPGRAQPALSAIDLVIARGARIAIAGPTGSGKSTLADLIMGLLDPDAGRVTVDGAALDAARRAAWRRSIAHVPQAIFLADASIARNIAFSSNPDAIDAERVADAAGRAQLASFVDSLPEGYETRVGERGVRLSGGQRQRLGIARALYKGAPVLVLDEATSALDDDTEAAVLASLDSLARDGGLTLIVIAHRRSTVEACDQIVRLEDGRIA
jgi:ABC-type multidrug transport system fused ATPase/permease subunit